MPANATNLNTLWAELIVEEFTRNGVATFCLSPGSRCAPLTVAVARNSNARNVIHFDERGAAFHALGCARATGRPAVLISTSGTAVANYMPAIVEAAMCRAPLIALTADRPPELLDTGANQTISQTGLFGNYVRWETTLPCPTYDVKPEVVLSAVNYAVARATQAPAGPAHINCMFREPLTPDNAGEDLTAYLTHIAEWFHTTAPYTSYTAPAAILTGSQLEELVTLIKTAKRGLVVLGELRTDAERAGASALVRSLNWPALPDVASGLRFSEVTYPFVPYYDQALLSNSVQSALSPDFILHLGGVIVSKRLQRFLEASNARQYVLIADHPLRQDPGHRVSARFESSVAETCAALARSVKSVASDQRADRIAALAQKVDSILDAALDQAGLSEPLVARLVSRRAPRESVVFLGNSMPVRDMDMYGATGGAPFRVAVNRGASGIDGNIATAAGYARALGKPATAVIGDLAALHDLNSLALLRELAAPFVLVVINNRGGGIFSFLPIAKYTDVFETYFGTPHPFEFARAAEMFSLAYEAPDTTDGFDRAYQAALAHQGATLIEVFTDRAANHRLHTELQRDIAAALDR